MADVCIIGGGVAGSTLAYRLSESGFRVTLFEAKERYEYPCGEAVPMSVFDSWRESPVREFAVTGIRRVVLCVRGRGCRSHDFGREMGYIIRKPEFVGHLIESAAGMGARVERRRAAPESVGGCDLVVDARGPFSDTPEYSSLGVVRGFTDARPRHVRLGEIDVDEETLYMYFDPDVMGYFWVFPSYEAKWNIGFGAPREPVLYWFWAMAAMHGIKPSDVRGVRGKKIKIADPLAAHLWNGVPRIGEAGGFIVPYTGEGIRPAIESASTLYQGLADGGAGSAFERLGRLASSYALHHRLFRLLMRIGPSRASKALLRLPPDDVASLVEGEPSKLAILRVAIYSVL